MRRLSFWMLFLCFWYMSFFVFILDAIFLWYSFFQFSEHCVASGLGYWMVLQFWHLWSTQRRFLVFQCVVVMLKVHESTKFLTLDFMFLKYVFFCVHPWCNFLWYNFFFIFQDYVWLVKSSCCVHCCSIHRVYWYSDRWGSEFAMWCFFVQKVVTTIW